MTGLKDGSPGLPQTMSYICYFIGHVKLVITQLGGDIQKAFRQYNKVLSATEGCLTGKGNKFMWSSKYGFLTSSPHDIGTGLEVQVKARLPKLMKVKTMYNKICTT